MEHSTQRQTEDGRAAPEPSQGNLLISLYDAAIRNLRSAHGSMSSQKPDEATEPILKTAAILEQLIEALDHARAPALCENLEQLYRYMLDRLHEAQTSSDAEPLAPVIRQLAELRDAWAQVIV